MATSVLKLQGLPALSAGSSAVSGGKPRCLKFSQSLRSRSIAAKRNDTKQIPPVVCEAAGTSVAGKQDANWPPVIPAGGALAKRERRLVIQDGESILLPRHRNEIYAIENSSPAEGAYAEGFISVELTQDGCIACPSTSSTYEPKTGQGRERYPKNPVLRAFTKSLRDMEVYSVPHKTAEQSYGIPDKPGPAVWDVVGLGQAMVDFSGVVHDSFLSSLDLVKGKRKVVNHEERGRVLGALDGKSYKVSAGGSLSNTLVALARLGIGRGLRVAMTGSVGSDPLGDFYRTKLIRANVHFLSKPVPDGTTGTVVVLTTPDAQRTMLSYQGMSSLVEWDPLLETAISSSKMLVVEGYLWELPETVNAIARACVAAKAKGVMVALTASDVSCVLRFRQQFWNVMCESCDILFTNVDEARALAGFDDSISPSVTARHLSQFCPLVSVTDGVNGAYLALKGEVVFVPPSPCTPIDTCGAGDAYAAGVLFSLLKSVPDLASIGALASRVAAVVVGQQGTRLREEDASQIADAIVQRNSPTREGLVVRSMEAMSSLGVWGGLGEGSNGTNV